MQWKWGNCGKEHSGKCTKTPECFNYGNIGHMRRDGTMPAKEQTKSINNNQPIDKGKDKIMAVAVK